LDANRKWTETYKLEKEAITRVNEEWEARIRKKIEEAKD